MWLTFLASRMAWALDCPTPLSCSSSSRPAVLMSIRLLPILPRCYLQRQQMKSTMNSTMNCLKAYYSPSYHAATCRDNNEINNEFNNELSESILLPILPRCYLQRQQWNQQWIVWKHITPHPTTLLPAETTMKSTMNCLKAYYSPSYHAATCRDNNEINNELSESILLPILPHCYLQRQQWNQQ